MKPTLAYIVPVGGGNGNRPDNSLPSGGHYPSHGLPNPPEVDNELPELPPSIPDNSLPPPVWPSVPVHPIPPNSTLPIVPGTIWPPLPPTVSGKVLVLVHVFGVGNRWIVVDTNAAKPK